MTNFNALQPRVCSNCRQPVLPGAPNTWVDQHGQQFCPGSRTPHDGKVAFTDPSSDIQQHLQKSSKKPWLFLGALVATLAVVLVTVIIVNPGDNADQPVAQSAQPTQPAESIASQPPTAPGAPILCDPESPRGRRCFAPEFKGTEMIQRIRDTFRGWKCYKHKDPAAPQYSGASDHTEVCEVYDHQEPYTRTIDIGHSNLSFNPDDPMEEVDISFGAAYTHGEEQKISGVEANKVGDLAFERTISVLWPNHPDIQQQARDTFKKVKEECDKSQAMLDGPHAFMPLGYKISCTSANTAFTITDKKGRAHTSYSGGIKIAAE